MQTQDEPKDHWAALCVRMALPGKFFMPQKASGIRIWRAGAGRAAATILMMHLLRPMHKGCPMKPQAVPAALFFFVFAAVAYQLHLTKTLQMFIIVMQKETIEIKS